MLLQSNSRAPVGHCIVNRRRSNQDQLQNGFYTSSGKYQMEGVANISHQAEQSLETYTSQIAL